MNMWKIYVLLYNMFIDAHNLNVTGGIMKTYKKVFIVNNLQAVVVYGYENGRGVLVDFAVYHNRVDITQYLPPKLLTKICNGLRAALADTQTKAS